MCTQEWKSLQIIQRKPARYVRSHHALGDSSSWFGQEMRRRGLPPFATDSTGANKKGRTRRTVGSMEICCSVAPARVCVLFLPASTRLGSISEYQTAYLATCYDS